MEHTERVQQEAIRRWMQRYERVESDLVEWKRQYDIQQRRACDAEAERDALRNEIAADWRAMVAALEASEKTLDAIGGLATVKDSGVITLLPYYARKLAKMLNETLPTVQAVLARVKGE